MTSETARREIESLDYYLQNHTNDYSEESHTAMMMAIDALSGSKNSNKWIPVSERLPENSGNYLITYCLQGKTETQEAVYVEDEDKWFDTTDIEITLAVIAWMPLPTPFEPQESEEEE